MLKTNIQDESKMLSKMKDVKIRMYTFPNERRSEQIKFYGQVTLFPSIRSLSRHLEKLASIIFGDVHTGCIQCSTHCNIFQQD
jgi:hypothetical protein